MTLIHRAVRRAELPIKYSSGFHPAPRISFGDALPLGIASKTELIDLELTAPCEPNEVMQRLNRELPEGVEVLQAQSWPRKAESPANSIFSATYCVPLPTNITFQAAKLKEFLAKEHVIVKRRKKKRLEEVDLRLWVKDLKFENNCIWMTMTSGSPLMLAAHLLEKDIEDARTLGICKTEIELKEHEIQVD